MKKTVGLFLGAVVFSVVKDFSHPPKEKWGSVGWLRATLPAELRRDGDSTKKTTSKFGRFGGGSRRWILSFGDSNKKMLGKRCLLEVL